MRINKFFIALATLAALCSCGVQRDTHNDISIQVDKIWGNGMYNAFTSLTSFKGSYYVVFREDDGHVWGDDGIAQGVIRVLRSRDGKSWDCVATLGDPGKDYRDPCICVTPDGRLMLHIMRSIYEGKTRVAGTNMVAFSSDGEHFTTPQQIKLQGDFKTGFDYLWKPEWAGNVCYGAVYSVRSTPEGKEVNLWDLTLVRSEDGINYSPVTHFDIAPERLPNETCLKVLPDGRMLAMIRTEGKSRSGIWGIAEPPYTSWKLTDMGIILGGPYFIVHDGKVIAATRTYGVPGSFKTILLKGTVEGKFNEVCFLPSGGGAGDTSYTGLLPVGDQLWVSFYSAHETPKPQIYMARMPLKMFE